MKTTAERIKEGMEIRNLKQTDLVEMTGISKGALSSYISGRYVPKQNNIYLISKALDVSESWLMGNDVPMERQIYSSSTVNVSNIYPIELKRFPMLGEIACGKPKYTNEDRESYIMAGTDIKADFCLKAKGDSMINARIHDGDIVFIQKQDTVENGEIAAVIVNNDSEATLKRFFYYQEKSLLILKPENSAYEDQIYQGEELNQVHVLGKAIAFQSDVR